MNIFKRKQFSALFLFAVLVLALFLSGCQMDTEECYQSLEDLRGKKVAVVTGSITEQMLLSHYGEDVDICYYNSNSDMAEALDSGKIDAYCACVIDANLQCKVYTEQHCLTETLDSKPVAFFFPLTESGEKLCAQMNEFIATEDIETLYQAWIDNPDEQSIPDTPLTAENGILTYACCTNIGQPQCYVKDNNIVGSEIDAAYRFCLKYGYGLKLEDYDLSGMLSAVSSGKADIGGSGTLVTEERQKSALFSNPTHYNNFVLTVKDSSGENTMPLYTDSEDLIGKNIGCVSGTSTDVLLEDYYDNDVHLSYYGTNTDMAAALEAGKIDAYCTDNTVAEKQCELYSNQVMLETPLQENDLAFFFRKDDADADILRTQMNEFILSLKKDGTLDEIRTLWTYSETNDLSVNTELSGKNGTLTLACSTTIGFPYCYIGNDGYMGYDIDLAYRFCRSYGYALEFMDCELGEMLCAVTTGNADFGCAHLAETGEQQQAVNFSEPYDTMSFHLVVKTVKTTWLTSFLSRFQSSFEKTFVSESRWKLFLNGIGTTLLITILAILFGTLVGYAVYMACRNGNHVVNRITDACMWLVNGMPTVVLLMLLFYVVFGSSSLSGTFVAVVAYTWIFAVGFIAMLRQSVDSLDPGQLEAAYALGYSKTAAFNKRILPQAIQRLLPAYKVQTVNLIKSTAIVGYIAVQDLTKAGDIIRSRTFEAFFPIIATAIFYFLMAAFLSTLVHTIQIGTDPKRRSKEQILKGVEK